MEIDKTESRVQLIRSTHTNEFVMICNKLESYETRKKSILIKKDCLYMMYYDVLCLVFYISPEG